ncbi:uncharacterized protein N7479_008271 [Penicillium vulpinum]|uniref:uncharacterized protein n=1 Tax=Penicillium vulpinum TaxID=29845 RepID=UPI00254964C8|nr:uncharacterized protein N7479_008271 [Penicillium vulpinum]KAJ5961121.1 hypothetical protein N7479_008271 [Penicillium vulpinum]
MPRTKLGPHTARALYTSCTIGKCIGSLIPIDLENTVPNREVDFLIYAATNWPEDLKGNMATDIIHTWQYGSHIFFADTVIYSEDKNGKKISGISDGQLWQISRDAVDEMVADRKRYGKGDIAEPMAMGNLAWGNEIILTSSMKGAPHFFYNFEGGNTVVGDALKTCSILSKRHKNNANCAEPMSAH